MSETIKQLQQHSEQVSRQERLALWIHENPTTVKAVQAVGGIAGLGMTLSLPWAAPLLGLASVGVGLSGVALIAAAGVSAFALDVLVPPHHDMKDHVYQPGECEGGRLYYEGDIPILSLDASDPFKAGKAQGYLCGNALHRVMERFDWVLHGIAKQPRAMELPKTLTAMRNVIPQEYILEMEGLAEGYNKWAEANRVLKKITSNDILLFHLLPDSMHFHPQLFERIKNRQSNVRLFGCSALIDRDPKRGTILARNMDWPSFGVTGTYSLVINRKHKDGLCDTAEVAVPGFVGTITGMNSEGLSLAMNVCGGQTSTIRGMPAAFFNRSCLERCKSVRDVEGFCKKSLPLGPYHLTVADREGGESIHLYQGLNAPHTIRRWKKGNPVATLNCLYHTEDSKDSFDQRQAKLDHFFKTRMNKPLEEALSLPTVCNWLTTHRVVMEPESRTMRVAFDNAFAGRAPLKPVPTNKIFFSRLPSKAEISFFKKLAGLVKANV